MRRSLTTTLGFQLMIFCFALNIQAKNVEYLTEEDVFSDMPVTSSVSGFQQKINEAPNSVIIIDRQMIEAAGVIDVQDLFRMIPGFVVYSPAYNHRVANYHTIPDGFPNRLEVKIDGRSVYEPVTNTVFWITTGLEIEDIEYIEVVRGSNLPSNGPNALNGSINIFTRSPLHLDKTTVRLTGGSNNTQQMSLGYNHTVENIAYRLSAGYSKNSGYSSYQGEDIDDDSDAFNTSLNLVWLPSLHDSVNFQFGYNKSDLVFDDDSRFVDPEDLFEWNTETIYQHLDWIHQLNDEKSYKLKLSHFKTDIDTAATKELFSDLAGFPISALFPGAEDFEVVLGIENGYSERYDFEMSQRNNFNDQLKFEWGGRIRKDRIKSDLHFSTNTTQSQASYGVFTNAEYKAKPWLTLNGGASFVYSGSGRKHPTLRLSSNIHLDQNNTIRLTAQKVEREHTLLAPKVFSTLHDGNIVYDLDTIADKNLDGEKLESIEVGYLGFFQNGKLIVDLKAFIESNKRILTKPTDHNYIHSLSIDNKVSVMSDVNTFKAQGIELYMKWQPEIPWSLVFQYSYLSSKANMFRDLNPTIVDSRKDTTPRNITTLILNHDFGHGLQSAITYTYQSAIDWMQAPGDRESLTPDDNSYDRLDFNLRKKFDFNGISSRLEFIAQNLFGEPYTSYRYFHQVKPRYYLRLITEF